MADTIKQLKQKLLMVLKPGVETTPYIWGKPGIGKSQAVAQIADELTKITGKPHGFIDLRLSQLESSDLRGIPVPDPENGIARWLPPEFLPFKGIKKFEGTYGILLLDEMNRARTDVLQAAFQLVLDRSVGLHELLDTWYIVAAGNLGLEDGTDVNELDRALKNRFIHFNVDVNLDAWIEWAKGAGIHHDVINFLQGKASYLYHTTNEEENVFITPRSWEKFSHILQSNKNMDPMKVTEFLGPNIINGAAGHFMKYLESKEIVQAKDILDKFGDEQAGVKGKLKVMQREQIYALNNEIIDHISKAKKHTKKNLRNLHDYCAEILEKDIYIALLQGITKACVANDNDFIDQYLKEFLDESKEIVKIISGRK